MFQRIALAACLLFSFAAYVKSKPSAEPGMLPYAPSRLEWLSVVLESTYREPYDKNYQFSLHYVPTQPNTITILVHYSPQTPAFIIDDDVETAKKLVAQEASNLGWTYWVKTDVRRESSSQAK